jgi:hypothetical protein
MQDFLGHVRASRATRGPTKGQRVSPAHAKTVLVHVEQFYLFMHDHKDAAAAATGEPGWRELEAGHAGFYRARWWWGRSVSGVREGFVGPPALSAVTVRCQAVTPPRRITPKPRPNACPRWCSAA